MEDRGKESTAIFSFIKGGIHYGNSAQYFSDQFLQKLKYKPECAEQKLREAVFRLQDQPCRR